MHTNLSMIKQLLFNGILDPSYKNFLNNGKSNQLSFMLAFFPLDFLRHEDNASIVETRSNNSSRLSNIFNRITKPKRNEEKFRERFLTAFNIDFYKDMVNSCTFFLRSYNKERFNTMIHSVLQQDEELALPEYQSIRNYIISNISTSPEKTLAMLIIWAFHISSFDKILLVINEYESFNNFGIRENEEDQEWHDLTTYLKSLHLLPSHVKSFMKIATTYGISGQMGAIALRTYVEQHLDVNPLIHCEVANMLYYGNNYPAKQPINAVNMYSACATIGYAPALWTMGQLSNHSRHNSNIKNAFLSKKYYIRSLEHNLPLSLNNLGLLYHRALVFYTTNIRGYIGFDDCFLHDSGSGISEIYHSIKEDDYFINLINKYSLDSFNAHPLTESEKYTCLNTLEAAENDILETYFIPGYEVHDYFYAAGSALTIYEHQYKRKEAYYSTIDKDFTLQDEYMKLKNNIVSTCEYFARYYCSESQYTYAKMLENYSQNDLQNAYDHYYLAAFDTPHKAFRLHALVRFLELHHSGNIMLKKQDIKPTNYLLSLASTQLLPYDPKEKLMLRTMSLIIDHLKIDYKTLLAYKESEKLRENLISEMYMLNDFKDQYRAYITIF